MLAARVSDHSVPEELTKQDSSPLIVFAALEVPLLIVFVLGPKSLEEIQYFER